MRDFDYAAPVLVMEPLAQAEPFDSVDHVCQVKWDGVRMVAFVGDGVRLQNRRLADRTAQYPELAGLTRATGAHRAVLDGEVVVLRGGKPSFPAVLRRDRVSDPSAARTLASVLPATYNIFDLLAVDTEDLRARPLEERLARLGSLLEPDAAWQVVDSFAGRGRELFAAAQGLGLEGIVMKERRSSYVAGKRSRAWLKVKAFRVQSFVLGGIAYHNGRPASLLLGGYRGEQLHYVGRVGSGLSEGTLQALDREAGKLARAHSPFADPVLPGRERLLYLHPALTGLVRYLEWTEDLRLRAPSWRGFSPATPQECRID